MIKVVIGNNAGRTEAVLDENITLKDALEKHEIDYTRGVIHLDGAAIQAGGLNKTFAEYGVTDRCFLTNVVKADNA